MQLEKSKVFQREYTDLHSGQILSMINSICLDKHIDITAILGSYPHIHWERLKLNLAGKVVTGCDIRNRTEFIKSLP